MREVKVLVDTSAWIAVLVPSDAHHAHAKGVFADLLAGNALVVTSNYIIDETVTWLRMHASHTAAVSFHDTITQSQEHNRLHLAWVTEAVEKKAWDLFTRHPGLKLSLTDCTSAVLAAELKLPIWSYDSDFVALGCQEWAS